MGRIARQNLIKVVVVLSFDIFIFAASPFLQVDHQVQQIASKVGMLDSHNLLTSLDPPKDVALKNPVAVETGAAGPAMNIVLNESAVEEQTDGKVRGGRGGGGVNDDRDVSSLTSSDR